MIKSQRIIAVIIAISLLAVCIPQTVGATKNEDTFSIRVSNGTSEKTYQGIIKDDEIFFSAEAYGEITKYNFTASDNYGYQLGEKIIVINPQNGEMHIPVQGYSGNIGSAISLDGVVYLPASQLLPWMNVSCGVENGILRIVPDRISLWEIVDDFDYSTYLFSIYEEYGESTFSTIGLGAMIMFDTFINLRWDRLIPTHKEGSLYDYKCYVQALSELGQITSFEDNNLIENAQKYIDITDGLKNFDEVLGVDVKAHGQYLRDYLLSSGMDESSVREILAVGDKWGEIQECMAVPGTITKYFDIFSAYKTFELISTTDNEYREYLDWLSEKGTGNKMFDKALGEARIILNENWGVSYTLVSKFCGEMLEAIPETVFTAIANNSLDDKVLEAFGNYSIATEVWGHLKLWTGTAKIMYSALFKESVEGYEGMAKASIMESIQNYCWNLAGTLRNEKLTKDTITHVRQSYITALQASKQLYQSQQGTMNFGVLGSLGWLENGDHLLDSQIQLIDMKIQQLVASADTTLNDSVEGKQEYTEKLQEMFSQITRIPDTPAPEIDFEAFLQNHPEYLYYAILDINQDGTPELLATESDCSQWGSAFAEVDLFVHRNGEIQLAYENLYSKDSLMYSSRNRWIVESVSGTGGNGWVFYQLDARLKVQTQSIEHYLEYDENGNEFTSYFVNGRKVVTEEDINSYTQLDAQHQVGENYEIIFQPVLSGGTSASINNRLSNIKIIKEDGRVYDHQFYYDQSGKLSRIEQNGYEWSHYDYTFSYDSDGRLVKMESGDIEQDFYEYKGREFSYDDMGRTTTARVFGPGMGWETIQFSYGSDGHISQMEISIEFEDDPSVYAFNYDTSGNLSEVKSVYPEYDYRSLWRYQYDRWNWVIKEVHTVQYSDGTEYVDELTYSYDYAPFVFCYSEYDIRVYYDFGLLYGEKENPWLSEKTNVFEPADFYIDEIVEIKTDEHGRLVEMVCKIVTSVDKWGETYCTETYQFTYSN